MTRAAVPVERARAPAARRSSWRAWLVLVLLALAVAGVWSSGDLLLLWVRRDHVVGIDVSHHQGQIDWGKVRAAGASFCGKTPALSTARSTLIGKTSSA